MKKVTTIGGFVVTFFGGFDAKNAMIAMLSFFCRGVATKKAMAVCCHCLLLRWCSYKEA